MRTRRKILLVVIAAFGVAALVIVRGKGPNAQSVVYTAASRTFDAAAADAYYQPRALSTLAAFLAKYDASRDGTIDAKEAGDKAQLRADIAGIFNAAEKLKALDALHADVALGYVPAGAAYWSMDMQARYLARRHRVIPEATLAAIDAGGRRRINGGEDIPAIMPFTEETVREYEVPWPPGNVAVADRKDRVRVFLTPFPDGNFTKAQVHELDLESGSLTPYLPSEEFQSGVMNSLGIEEHGGVLYIIDHGFYGMSAARLVGIDLATDQVILDHRFEIELGQMPNDVVFVEEDGMTKLFISDTAPGRSPFGSFNAKSGLIEIDLAWRDKKPIVADLRRHLDGDPIVEDGGYSLYPDRDAPATTWLGELGWGGVDGIGFYDGRVYFKRMLDPVVRAAPFGDIRPQTSVVVDELPFMDGFRIDPHGNLFFGDVENSALFAYHIRTGALVKIMEDSRFHWIDEVNVHGDKAYVTTSHLHEFMYEASSYAKRRALDAARPFHFFVIDLKPAYAVLERLVKSDG